MKRLIVLFCVTLLVFPLVMAGCGVAEADYEAVVAERDALQTEKNALQAEKDALESEKNMLQAEKDELETELDATKSDVATLVAELDKKLAASVLVNGYFIDAMDYITGKMSLPEVIETRDVFIAEVGEALDGVGNEELSQLWDSAEAAAAANHLNEFTQHFTAILDLLQELSEDDVAAIETSLS